MRLCSDQSCAQEEIEKNPQEKENEKRKKIKKGKKKGGGDKKRKTQRRNQQFRPDPKLVRTRLAFLPLDAMLGRGDKALLLPGGGRGGGGHGWHRPGGRGDDVAEGDGPSGGIIPARGKEVLLDLV